MGPIKKHLNKVAPLQRKKCLEVFVWRRVKMNDLYISGFH